MAESKGYTHPQKDMANTKPYSRIDLSIVSLAAANMVPVVGVIWFGWNAAVIILLYWSENVIIGLYGVLKLTLPKVDNPLGDLCKLFVIPFFCVHFGGFCAAHGLFLMVLLRLSAGIEAAFQLGEEFESLFRGLTWPGPLIFPQLLILVIAGLWRGRPLGSEWQIAGLLVSHGVSFIQNYIFKREYRSATLTNLMFQPYERVLSLHAAIIVAGVPVVMLGSPVPLLFFLVALKVAMDVRLHVRSHRFALDAPNRPDQCQVSE
ncbi:MAG: DUF6498-containing protein [bacterium]|nr:DUF6498-containing protein [bacterium]